jgi:hypothetical protein
MKILTLTDLSGNKVLIASTWIQMLSKPIPGTWAPNANTIVTLSGEHIAVQETVEQIQPMWTPYL